MRINAAMNIKNSNILYLTKVLPYNSANSGDAVYSRGIIEALSQECNLTVICNNNASLKHDVNRINIDWNIASTQKQGKLGSLITIQPLISWKNDTSTFNKLLDSFLLKKWDAIVLDNIGLSFALSKAIQHRLNNPDTKLIYISHEYEYRTRESKYNSYSLNVLQKLASAIDLYKVKLWEESLIKKCDIVTVINESDLSPFRSIDNTKKYLPVVPGYDGPVEQSRTINSATPKRILVLGGRKSEQKRQILLDWMQKAYYPLSSKGIEIVIAGDMDDDLRVQLKNDYPNAQILGFVDNLRDLILSSRMGIIADTVGGGFKLRLLSQVFGRLPIIGLTKSIDGLSTRNGEGYLSADNLDELVSLVCDVIDNDSLLNALHESAFNDCSAIYSWDTRSTAIIQAINGNCDSLK